jgi:Predicted transcriptional regulator containing an HTH domain and an uncharacterized domain shared with the mammalian protein Schlafen
MTLAELGHKSVRRNALIADLLHRIDFIEKAGTGIRRIRDDVRAQGCPDPEFESNGFFTAIFRPNPEVRAMAAARSTEQVTGEVTGQVGGQVTGQVAEQVLRFCQTPRKAGEIRELLNLKHRETFTDNYLRPLLEKGWLEPTIPDKPRSSKQRYRLTRAGLEYLKKIEEPK